jgi:hypothetical protein
MCEVSDPYIQRRHTHSAEPCIMTITLFSNVNVAELATSFQYDECKQTSSDLSGNFQCSIYLCCPYNFVAI